MISKSDDFERFLEAHYPDAYLRITSDNVKEDVYRTIFSEYESRFNKWKNVPQWIRDLYRDTLPVEILNGNIPVDDFVENIKCTYSPISSIELAGFDRNDYNNLLYVENRDFDDKTARGYSAEHVRKLLENKHIRDCMCKLCRPLTAEERKIWRESRKRDRHIITESFKKDQPHKMVYHSIKQYDACIRQMRKEKSAKKKMEYFIRAAKHKYEILKYLPRIENKILKRGLMRMYIVAKKELGFKRMKEERKKIAKYVAAKPPKSRVNTKGMADVLGQIGMTNEM